METHSHPRASALVAAIAALAIALSGCSSANDGIAVLWTDQVEFASYAELFNASQNRYRVVVQYQANPAGALIAAKARPDLIVGPWLKGEKARSSLVPIDYLFNEFKMSQKQFYGPLLDLGNVQGRQYLLPVSFNLPALIFSPDNSQHVTVESAIELEEIKSIAGEFNHQQKGAFTKMGFSPRWYDEFLYMTAQLYDVRFEEGKKLFAWNDANLRAAVTYLINWSATVNGSTTAEDDFEFKYLYDPPNRLITEGRSLFAYMPTNELFVLPQDKQRDIDFRWITKDGKTTTTDGIIYMGVCRGAPHLDAAEAFLIWFFNENTQKALLERGQKQGTMDRSFGISGGFSSLREVNEKSFPLYYPTLLGHLPPADHLTVPRILPNNWELLRMEIVIPWLNDAVRAANPEAIPPLTDRIEAWLKTH
jgi:ABC-type glycerol-3-phosphate transport system substrate-binding protein